MIFKDYYKILGLNDNKVSIEEIKAAYREQAKKYHPDINVGDNIAEERFKDINEAYKTLCDPSQKRKYDRQWNSRIASKKNKKTEKKPFIQELLQIFFGQSTEVKSNKSKKGNNKSPVHGENVDTQIDISLSEAFYGAEKKISLRTVDGKMKSFNVKIPQGIQNQEKIRLIGQGKPGINGAKNGDLFININILDDKRFKLDGCDLYTDLKITPWEAILGSKITLDTLDETISIIIPKMTQNSEKICIKQKGYKDGKGNRGDLYAIVKIVIPKQISQEEEKIYKNLKDISQFNPRG